MRETSVKPSSITAPAQRDLHWVWKGLAGFAIVLLVLIPLKYIYQWRTNPTVRTASVERTVTNPVVSSTAHCNKPAATYNIGDGEVVVNRQGLCSTVIWYPPSGCVEMRRARSRVFDGPYGHCPGSKGIWGPNDMEAMRSYDGRVVILDIALGPPRYN